MQYELPLKIVSYEVRRAYIQFVILTGFVFFVFFFNHYWYSLLH